MNLGQTYDKCKFTKNLIRNLTETWKQLYDKQGTRRTVKLIQYFWSAPRSF